MKYIINYIGISLLLLNSCEATFIPDLARDLKPKTGNYIHSVNMGVRASKIIRDDQQSLLVIVASERLPLKKMITPSFSLSEGALVFPLDVEYFDKFSSSNPAINVKKESFIFPDIMASSFLQTLKDAIRVGQKVNVPTMTPTVLSSQIDLYLPNIAYSYIVVAENGSLRNWRIKVADPGLSNAEIIDVSLPGYRNPELGSTYYPIIVDNDRKIVSGIVPYGSSLKELFPYFIISPGARMSIDGKAYDAQNGGSINFEKAVEVKVASANDFFSTTYEMWLTEAPSGNSLNGLSVPSSENPQLSTNIVLFLDQDGQTFTAEVPHGTDLSSLQALAVFSPGARLSVGGEDFINGVTALDYSTEQVFTVTSTSGATRDYKVNIIADKNNADLLDFKIRPQDNEGLLEAASVYLNERQKSVKILLAQKWDLASPLNFRYQVSAGATAALDSLSLNTLGGELSKENSILKVTAADGSTSKDYQLLLVLTTDTGEAKLLDFALKQSDNSALIPPAEFLSYPQPSIDESSKEVRINLPPIADPSRLGSSIELVPSIVFSPGAEVFWDTEKTPYKSGDPVDFSRDRRLKIVALDAYTSDEYIVKTELSEVPGPVIYVAPDGLDYGSSWAEPTNLDLALSWLNRLPAGEGRQLWLKAGSYVPRTNGLGRNKHYQLTTSNKIEIYGGFVGTEAKLSERARIAGVQQDWSKHKSILSGDVNGDDVPGDLSTNRRDNLYSLITSTGAGDLVLDALTLSSVERHKEEFTVAFYLPYKPNKRGTQIILNNINVTSNNNYSTYFNLADSGSLELRNSKFTANSSPGEGGALLIRSSRGNDIKIDNNIFSENRSKFSGGALFIHLASSNVPSRIELTSTKFINNSSGHDGGAIHLHNLSSKMQPILIFKNLAFIENTAAQASYAAYTGSPGSPGAQIHFYSDYNMDASLFSDKISFTGTAPGFANSNFRTQSYRVLIR